MSRLQITNLLIGVVLATTLLVGCTSATVFPSKEPIPEALLTTCSEPLHLEGTDGKKILENYVANAALWKECRDNHSNLIKAVKATQ